MQDILSGVVGGVPLNNWNNYEKKSLLLGKNPKQMSAETQ